MRLKKVKNALERVKMSNYYVDEPQLNKDKWNMVFENNNPIHIEIGMGKGNFIIGMAKQNKDINYIGIEMYDSVMVKAVEKLKDEEPLNKSEQPKKAKDNNRAVIKKILQVFLINFKTNSFKDIQVKKLTLLHLFYYIANNNCFQIRRNDT